MDLPAGTATGAVYSGNYAIDTNFLSCHCRVGTCSEFHLVPNRTFQLLQQDGMLTQADPGGLSTGGIDADGAYAVGAAMEDGYGVTYWLTEGEIHLADGVPEKGHATVTLSVTGDFGINVDCDLRVIETFHYEGAL
jgi:hypothetical protein